MWYMAHRGDFVHRRRDGSLVKVHGGGEEDIRFAQGLLIGLFLLILTKILLEQVHQKMAEQEVRWFLIYP
jgi:hypothetical protein